MCVRGVPGLDLLRGVLRSSGAAGAGIVLGRIGGGGTGGMSDTLGL